MNYVIVRENGQKWPKINEKVWPIAQENGQKSMKLDYVLVREKV